MFQRRKSHNLQGVGRCYHSGDGSILLRNLHIFLSFLFCFVLIGKRANKECQDSEILYYWGNLTSLDIYYPRTKCVQGTTENGFISESPWGQNKRRCVSEAVCADRCQCSFHRVHGEGSVRGSCLPLPGLLGR